MGSPEFRRFIDVFAEYLELRQMSDGQFGEAAAARLESKAAEAQETFTRAVSAEAARLLASRGSPAGNDANPVTP